MAARPSGGYAALRPACAGCWIATRYGLACATVTRNAHFPPNSRCRNVRPSRGRWALPAGTRHLLRLKGGQLSVTGGEALADTRGVQRRIPPANSNGSRGARRGGTIESQAPMVAAGQVTPSRASAMWRGNAGSRFTSGSPRLSSEASARSTSGRTASLSAGDGYSSVSGAGQATV